MEGVAVAIVAVVLLTYVTIALRRQRKRAADVDLEDKGWLRTTIADEEPKARRAPVAEFHVHGHEARVTFDVPLPDEEDPVLNDLLVEEAVEVVREKRHVLPIDDVTEIVVLAGRATPREVGRTTLASPGELPPPMHAELVNLAHIAKDPFAGQFEEEKGVHYGTRVQVPGDELRPLQAELKLPLGMDRGLRTRGIDPQKVSAPELILGLLELFGYLVAPQAEAGTYTASKDGGITYIRTVIHNPGEHPELDEAIVRKFLFEYETGGAGRGLLITDKYGPFLIHEIESKEPLIRFITRERTQEFIDSMALG